MPRWRAASWPEVSAPRRCWGSLRPWPRRRPSLQVSRRCRLPPRPPRSSLRRQRSWWSARSIDRSSFHWRRASRSPSAWPAAGARARERRLRRAPPDRRGPLPVRRPGPARSRRSRSRSARRRPPRSPSPGAAVVAVAVRAAVVAAVPRLRPQRSLRPRRRARHRRPRSHLPPRAAGRSARDLIARTGGRPMVRTLVVRAGLGRARPDRRRPSRPGGSGGGRDRTVGAVLVAIPREQRAERPQLASGDVDRGVRDTGRRAASRRRELAVDRRLVRSDGDRLARGVRLRDDLRVERPAPWSDRRLSAERRAR